MKDNIHLIQPQQIVQTLPVSVKLTDETKAIVAAQLTAAFFSKSALTPADWPFNPRLQELKRKIESQFPASYLGLAETLTVYEFFLANLSSDEIPF